MCENSGQFSRTTAHYLSSALSPIDMPLDGGAILFGRCHFVAIVGGQFPFPARERSQRKSELN